MANVERRVSKMHSPLTDMRSICVCVYRLLRNRNVIASLADLCGAYLRQEKVLEATSDFVLASRSEERRVGKECRSRWSPYH